MPKHRPDNDQEIATVQRRWTDLLVVCRKCERKLEGGYGPAGQDTLTDTIKKQLRAVRRRHDVRLLTSSCLGVCPKDAVALIRGDQPGVILVVPTGIDPGRLSIRLGINPSPSEAGSAA